EVERLARVLPGARVLEGNRASARVLRAMSQRNDLRGLQLLHFALHSDGNPGYQGREALLFPGREALDRRLGGEEIANTWRLSADMVCLASCQSALGSFARGEGNIGLAESFLRAGACSVLVSEWPVEDHATAMLLERFYQLWLGRSGPHETPA